MGETVPLLGWTGIAITCSLPKAAQVKLIKNKGNKAALQTNSTVKPLVLWTLSSQQISGEINIVSKEQPGPFLSKAASDISHRGNS